MIDDADALSCLLIGYWNGGADNGAPGIETSS